MFDYSLVSGAFFEISFFEISMVALEIFCVVVGVYLMDKQYFLASSNEYNSFFKISNQNVNKNVKASYYKKQNSNFKIANYNIKKINFSIKRSFISNERFIARLNSGFKKVRNIYNKLIILTKNNLLKSKNALLAIKKLIIIFFLVVQKVNILVFRTTTLTISKIIIKMKTITKNFKLLYKSIVNFLKVKRDLKVIFKARKSVHINNNMVFVTKGSLSTQKIY